MLGKFIQIISIDNSNKFITTKRLKICIDTNIEISEVDHYMWVFNFFT